MNLARPQVRQLRPRPRNAGNARLVGGFDFQAATGRRRGDPRNRQAVSHGRGFQPHFPGQEPDLRDPATGHAAGRGHGRRPAGPRVRPEQFAVFGASNSGKTKELISLFTQLGKQGHAKRFGLTANSPCTLETVSNRCYTLRCGKEDAVAATKSVVEQALFYRSLLAPLGEAARRMAANQQEAGRKAQRSARKPRSTRRWSRRSPRPRWSISPAATTAWPRK